MPSPVPQVIKPLIIFSHGNSFPASTYSAMTASLTERGYTVRAIEKLGHDPAYPVTSNWPHLVQHLADFAQLQARESELPIVLVGHSLGGFLSLMCAALHPGLANGTLRGVVMLDSPIISGWRAKALELAKLTRLVGRLGPGAISQKRKNRWASKQAVFQHFRSKKAFALWTDEALHDYVNHGTEHDSGQHRLAFDRRIETAIYNSLPHNMGALVARCPPQCPVAFIGGMQSLEIGRVGLGLTRRVTQGRLRMIEGSHLFPIEHPLATAAAVDEEITRMLQAKTPGLNKV